MGAPQILLDAKFTDYTVTHDNWSIAVLRGNNSNEDASYLGSATCNFFFLSFFLTHRSLDMLSKRSTLPSKCTQHTCVPLLKDLQERNLSYFLSNKDFFFFLTTKTKWCWCLQQKLFFRV